MHFTISYERSRSPNHGNEGEVSRISNISHKLSAQKAIHLKQPNPHLDMLRFNENACNHRTKETTKKIQSNSQGQTKSLYHFSPQSFSNDRENKNHRERDWNGNLILMDIETAELLLLPFPSDWDGSRHELVHQSSRHFSLPVLLLIKWDRISEP